MSSLPLSTLHRLLIRFWRLWLALSLASLLLSATGIMAQSTPGPTEMEPVDCTNSSADPGCVGTPSFVDRKLFGTGRDLTNSVRTGDVDGDGFLDIVQANDGQSAVYLNDGSGNFVWQGSERRFGSDKDNTLSIAVGDVNNDGMLDIVAGREDGSGVIFFNQNGAFQIGVLDCAGPDVVCLATGSETIEDVALGDLDGKNGLDILLAGPDGAMIYFNNGRSEFPAQDTKEIGDAEVPGSASRIALADLDGKDGLDIVLGGHSGSGRIFYNDGSGNFPTKRVQGFDSPADTLSGLVIADIDGHNGLDIAVSSTISSSSAIYLNDGAGRFDDDGSRLATGMQATAVAAGDLDGNGYIDLVWGDSLEISTLWLFGKGTDYAHPLVTSFGAREQSVTSVALADLDNDSSLDIILGTTALRHAPNGTIISRNSVFFNDQTSSLTSFTSTQITEDSTGDKRELWLGDIDDNGSLDAAVSLSSSGMTILQNDGSGNLSVKAEYKGFVRDIAFADFDNKNGADIVAADTIKRNVIVQKQSEDGAFDAPGHIREYPVGPCQSVALGDMNGDGYIDIVAGNQTPPHIVLINDGDGNFTRSESFGTNEGRTITVSVYLGDFNADGHLDVLTVNLNAPATIYYNDGSARFHSDAIARLGSLPTTAQRAAAGDVNGDEYLDVVLPVLLDKTLIFLNDGHGQFPSNLSYDLGPYDTAPFGVDLGDLNSDGHLDIAIFSNDEPVKVYQNDGAGGFSTETARTYELSGDSSAGAPLGGYVYGDVKLGDMDGDGQLDLVVAANDEVRVYLSPHLKAHHLANTPPILRIEHPVDPVNTSGYASATVLDGLTETISYTLSDRENDPVRLLRACYSVDGGGYWQPALEAGQPAAAASEVIRPANGCPYIAGPQSSQVITREASSSGSTHKFVWDLSASGFYGQSDNVVFRLEAYPSQGATPNGVPGPFQRSYVATQTYPMRMRGSQARVLWKTPLTSDPLSDAIVYRLSEHKESGAEPLGGLAAPYQTSATGFLQGRAGMTLNDRLIALWPSNEVTETTPVRLYSSGALFPLTVSPAPGIQSSLAISDSRRIGEIAVWVDISATAPLAIELTTPSGERVSLLDGPLPAGQSLCDAEMSWSGCDAAARYSFALTPTLAFPATPLANGIWTLDVRTTQAVTKTVQLLEWGLAMKLSPLNYTSAQPVPTGLDAYAVTAGGVQTLTVSSDNPLLLFDLNVALEWNAVNDQRFQTQLSSDLRRASELLYDWTNGQIALGNVHVYHDARRNTLPDGTNAWNNAHVRIYGSNRLRPNADQGGIISEPFTETVQINNLPRSIGYLPGQVRMGAMWNRYGDATAGNLGDDWPAAFAHELGHYLLFLDDNYLTLQDNLLVPLQDDDCKGAMNNPYSNVYSEFHPEQGWEEDARCKETLSELNTGRSDWETIDRFYPQLNQPTETFTDVLPGPSLLPLAVTQVTWQAPDPNSDTLTWLARTLDRSNVEPDLIVQLLCNPDAPAWGDRTNLSLPGFRNIELRCPTDVVTSTAPLEVPIFYLKSANTDDIYEASSQARAFLFQGLPVRTVIDLGQPGENQVLARGARPLDRLCVYDPPQDLVGCKDIMAGDDQIIMGPAAGWKPQLLIIPVTTRTLQISMTLPLAASEELSQSARLYPMDGPALPLISLTRAKTDSQIIYSGLITTTEPVLEGYVWVGDPNDTPGPNQTIAEFAIGGNPVRIRARRSPTDPRGVRIRARRVRIRARRAPATSVDGQVMVYPDEKKLPLDKEWSFTLQPATRLPAEIAWATPVGRAYWLAASGNITDTGSSSISFEYLRSDVPAGEEAFVRMYFWDEAEMHWSLIRNQQNYPEHNLISAPVERPGLYALFSHYEIPLQPGWNLLGYPVQTSGVPTDVRHIADALKSIEGQYSAVYGYYPCDVADPVKVYGTEASAWVNDLPALEFGHGYWINVTATDPITLYLKGSFETTGEASTPVCPSGQAGAMLHPPPTTYFGNLTAGAGFSPTAGLPVVALVDGVICGRGVTEPGDDGDRYTVAVDAAGAVNDWQCGGPGKTVTFEIDGEPVQPPAPWSELGLYAHDLTATESATDDSSGAACRELLADGDFEGSVLLDEFARNEASLASGIGTMNSGALRIVTQPRQQVGIQVKRSLPALAETATFSFAYRRPSDSAYGPNLRLLANGTEVWQGQASSPTWQKASVDLSQWRGQEMILMMEVVNWHGRSAMSAYLDDFSLSICQ